MIDVHQDPTSEQRPNPGERPSSAPEWYGQDGGGKSVLRWKHHLKG